MKIVCQLISAVFIDCLARKRLPGIMESLAQFGLIFSTVVSLLFTVLLNFDYSLLSFLSIPQIISRDQDAPLTPVKSPFLDAPASPTPASLRAAPACRHMGRLTAALAHCRTLAEQTLVTVYLCLNVMLFAAAVMSALTGWCRGD